MEHLLHPDLLGLNFYLGENIGNIIEDRSRQVAVDTETALSGVSFVIRTRNDRDNLRVMLDDVEKQGVDDVEVILVDTESNDGTTELAKAYGAVIVPIEQAAFSYPLSLNMGMEAASHDTVFMTVGHANLATDVALRAALQHKANGVAGAAGPPLLNSNASLVERACYTAGIFGEMRSGGLREATRPMSGVLRATGAYVDKAIWREFGGFDERYALGGEDVEFAARLLASGLTVLRDPALSMHHSHGLGVINTLKQIRYWLYVTKPREFEAEKLLARRPDLAAKFR